MRGELSPLERRLADCVTAGEVLDCGPGGATPDAVAAVDDWDARLLRADVLVLMATGTGADHPVSPRMAVRVRGAFITGRFDLADVDLDVPVAFEVCRFEEPVELTGARARSVSLARCELPALWADELEIAHSMRLDHSSFTAGPVRLGGARVGGELVLAGAKLAGTDERGQALIAHRLRAAAISLDGGFESAGAITLHGATTEGNLELTGAKLLGVDHDGNALVGDGLRVGGGARLGGGFEAAGTVRLWGADIGAQLNLRGARLAGSDANGDALVADEAHVSANALLTEGFEAAGAVGLRGARIDGNLELSGQVAGRDRYGNALRADRLHVRGNLLIRDAWVSGEIRLVGAVADGHGALSGVHDVPRLVLEGARCGSLRHDRDSWPPTGELRLRGFRFGELVGDADWRERLDWVRRQGFTAWSPDPYEQLAEYYTRIGDESAARRARIARHDDELTHLRLAGRRGSLAYRFWRRPFGWLVGYGYRRWPAGLLLALTLGAAGVVFHLADQAGAMIPTDQAAEAGGDSDPREPCGDQHGCFNAAVYGADVVLPVIDFGQDSAWRPSERTAWGRWAAAARWIFIGVGWVLASVFVAAFTRLVQRD